MSDLILVSADINCHVTCHNMFVSQWCSQHTRGRISFFTSVRFASSVTAYDKKHKITGIHNNDKTAYLFPLILLIGFYGLSLFLSLFLSVLSVITYKKYESPPLVSKYVFSRTLLQKSYILYFSFFEVIPIICQYQSISIYRASPLLRFQKKVFIRCNRRTTEPP